MSKNLELCKWFSVRNRQTFHLCGHWFFSENVAAFFAWRSFPAVKYNYVNHLAKSLCRPQCRYGRQARFLSKSDWQDVQILLQWIVSIGMMPRVFPKQDATAAAPRAPAKAIRTAGSNAANRTACGGNFCCLIDWVKSSSFISWSLKTRLLSASKLVKWSIRVVKVIFAI